MNLSYFGLFSSCVRLGIALHSGFSMFIYILALLCFDDVIFGLECMKLCFTGMMYLEFSPYQMKNTTVTVTC